MSAVHQAILNRRTIHDFSPEPVDEAALQRALEAGHSAPCHKCTWPWRFTRAGPQTREALFEVAMRLKQPPDERTTAKLRAKVCNPPVLIAVSQVLASDLGRQTEDYAAIACAIQNICVSLAAEGIGSKWGTGGLTRDPESLSLLGIDTETEKIVGFLWIGVPSRDHIKPPRPPLATVLRETS